MSLFTVFQVSSSAMTAQSMRLNAVASNLANADSVVLLITRLGRDHPQLPEVNTRE